MKAVCKFAFLDRDGTLIFEPADTKQIDSLESLQVLDGVVSGLKLLKANGYKLIMVTNQDGLGGPAFPLAGFNAAQQAMLETFKKAGIEFEQIFICPHFARENCTCRKPKTGLLTSWLKTVLIDKQHSFVCGDRPSDKTLAQNLQLGFVPMTTNGNFYEIILQGARIWQK